MLHGRQLARCEDRAQCQQERKATEAPPRCWAVLRCDTASSANPAPPLGWTSALTPPRHWAGLRCDNSHFSQSRPATGLDFGQPQPAAGRGFGVITATSWPLLGQFTEARTAFVFSGPCDRQPERLKEQKQMSHSTGLEVWTPRVSWEAASVLGLAPASGLAGPVWCPGLGGASPCLRLPWRSPWVRARVPTSPLYRTQSFRCGSRPTDLVLMDGPQKFCFRVRSPSQVRG